MFELKKQVETEVSSKEVFGAPSFNNTETDLYLHREAPGDSCFVVGNLKGEDGRTYNFLVHNGAMIPDGNGAFCAFVSMVSLTDKEGKAYIHEEKTYPYAACTFRDDRLEIVSPTTSLTGNAKQMKVYGKLPDERGNIALELENYGPTLENCGNGKFSCMDDQVIFHHYGMPYLRAKGSLQLDGREILVSGDAWLDRQWGSGNLPLVMAQNKIQTKWMDLNLSNGYKVSLWDILVDGGKENSWATILSPDGIHTIAPMTPLKEYEEDFWYSEATGNYYPTKYVVEFPALKTRINVQVYDGIPNQEAISSAGYHRYEAHSTCEGLFMGEKVTGFCCVELVGNFGMKGAAESESAGSDVENAAESCETARFDSSLTGSYKGILHSPMGEKEILFHYQAEPETLTGTVVLMGKTSDITDALAVSGGFTHHFKMKVPIGSVDVTVRGKLDGDRLSLVLKTPMGELPIEANRIG